MKEKIQRGFFIAIIAILSTVLFVRVTDSPIMTSKKNDQSAKNEVTEATETESGAFTTTIPLSRVRVIEKPTDKEQIEPIKEFEQDLSEIEHEPPKLYTDNDAIAMAKLLYGEARGVQDLYIWDGRVISSEYQKACVIWCVLNRYDAGWEDSIFKVISAYKQFHGYSPNNPVTEEYTELAYDVLDRWNNEQYGETDVGRVLPHNYLYFYGDMKNNYFTDEYGDLDEYNWDLADPYI